MRWCTTFGFAMAALAGCAGPEPVAVLGDIDGVAFVLDADADTTDPGAFYDQPWPLDSRRVDGAIDLRGYPMPEGHIPGTALLSRLRGATGFSTVPTVRLRFREPVAPVHPSDGPLEHALLLPLDGGPAVPVVGHALERDDWAPSNLLALGPAPGHVLRAGVPHAALVLRSFGDAQGAPLGVPAALRELLHPEAHGDAPPALAAAYAPLRDAWPEGIERDEVAAATVFTPRDVVAEAAVLRGEVRDRYGPEITGLTLHSEHPDYCALRGTIELPQFQDGEPPFDTEGGAFVFDRGELVEQRRESAPWTLILPRQPMPEGGYPLVFYGHGSGGDSREVLDRGPVLEPGGERTPGEGPGAVLARRGFAAAGLATLNCGERIGVQLDRPYLRLGNLAAYPDTWRQAVLDAGLLLDAMARLELDPAMLGSCDASGAERITLRTDRIALMGQSAGAHLATELGALDPRVGALAPTGSGGYWSLLLAGGSPVGGPPEIFAALLGTDEELSILHPGLALLQHTWEPAEPMVYAPRLSERPLEGEPRDVFLGSSADDGYFPQPIYDAMAVAYGLERAGEPVWSSMDEALAGAGLGSDLELPASRNRGDWTGIAVHWPPDGVIDSHGVFMQTPANRHQWGCFLQTWRDGQAVAVLPEQDDGAPCTW